MIEGLVNNEILAEIQRILTQRVRERVPYKALLKIIGGHFIVAGNSLNEDAPNDIDVYPYFHGQFDHIISKLNTDDVVCVTRNATTAKIEGKIVQFCNYHQPTFDDLLASFDFAHTQVGAVIFNSSDEPMIRPGFTQDWIMAKTVGHTKYTGSEYPLSSLIRISKYIKRGDFNGKSYIRDILLIMTDILNRGIKNYEDFKDQLDAIDLHLLGKDVEVAMDLFHAFQNVVPTPKEK